jgi:hypothetical protein
MSTGAFERAVAQSSGRCEVCLAPAGACIGALSERGTDRQLNRNSQQKR